MRASAATSARSAPAARTRWGPAAPTAAASSCRGRAGCRGRAERPTRKTDMLNDPIVIVGAARTPMGGLLGDFASVSASELGAVAIRAAVERAGIAPADVQEVIMGNVLP